MSPNTKPSLVFLGSPQVAVLHLRALCEAKFPILAVVTQPDKPAGRGQKLTPPPVKEFAQQQGLNVLQPLQPKSHDFVQELRVLQPDFIVVVAYGRLLSQELIDIPKYKCLNVHFSLLPKYRGASCVLSALRNGDPESGVSIMEVVQALDAGPIYLQEKMNIGVNENTAQLEARLAELGSKLLPEVIQKIALQQLRPIPQNESQVSFAPLILKEEGKINWAGSAEKIHNHIRAMNPWPGAFCELEGKKFKIWESNVEKVNSCDPIPKGQIINFSSRGLEVACEKSSLLLTQIQPESKKRLSATELWAGYQNLFKIGKNFS